MQFPKWSLFLFPILAIVLIIMFPILAIVVPVAVAIWAVIAAQKAAATKPQVKLALGENELQAISALDEPTKTGPTQPRDSAIHGRGRSRTGQNNPDTWLGTMFQFGFCTWAADIRKLIERKRGELKQHGIYRTVRQRCAIPKESLRLARAAHESTIL